MDEQERQRLTRFAEWLLEQVGEYSRDETEKALNIMAGYAFQSGVIYCREHTEGKDGAE